jgi:hypothetical protein
MAPCTFDGLAHRTAFGGLIRHGNPEFANVDGPMPTFGFGPGQVLHFGGPDSMVYGRHAPRTAPGGHIPRRGAVWDIPLGTTRW